MSRPVMMRARAAISVGALTAIIAACGPVPAPNRSALTKKVPPKLPVHNACPAGPMSRPPPAPPPVVGTAQPPPAVYVVDNHRPPTAATTTPYVVDVIDPASSRITRTIDVGAEPHHIYVVPGENEAYVTHFIGCSIDVIDLVTQKVIGQVPTDFGPRHMAFSADGRLGFAVDYFDAHLTIIDTHTNRVLANVATGPYPNYPVAAAKGGQVYVADAGSDTVTVIATTSPYRTIATIKVGPKPFNLALTPDGKTLVVANAGNDTVSLVDTSTLRTEATVAIRRPGQTSTTKVSQKLNVTITADGRYAWVGDEAGSAAAAIDLLDDRVAGRFPAAPGSDELFPIDGGSERGLGIITARYGGYATVVNTEQPAVARTVPTVSGTSPSVAAVGETGPPGSGSHQVTFDPTWRHAFVSDRPGSTVSVLDLTGTFPRLEVNIRTTYFPYGYPDGIAYVEFLGGVAQSSNP